MKEGIKYMTETSKIPLSRMVEGQSGKIIDIQGGQGLVNRLNALNVRPGRRVTKLSSMFMRGPVTIATGNSQLAIGYGMAKRIIVEIERA
jgi:ferrous iron transport protein A